MGWLVLACASSAPPPQAQVSAKRAPPADIVFPPTGPVELHAQPAPADGTLYRLLMSYDGRTELTADNARDPEVVDEKVSLQIDFRQIPVATPAHDDPAQNDLASSLLLLALNRRARMQPPGTEHLLEIGDDRLRTQANNKVDTDLRGAQPKQDLTPRTVIGKSFALVVDDAAGDPKGVTIHGTPRRSACSRPCRCASRSRYLQIAFPNRAVSAGDTWHGKRFLPNPIGKLGLAVDVEYRLVGFERIGGGAVRARRAARARGLEQRAERGGLHFTEVRYSLTGRRLARSRHRAGRRGAHRGRRGDRLPEDGGSRCRRKSACATRALRAAEIRLTAVETIWADGTKKFSAVK